MPSNLDPDARRILNHLVKIAPEVNPATLTGFPTYHAMHVALGLEMRGRTWGDSLDRQGMGNLAVWANENGYPAITGFIISGEKSQPADGFFKYYGKDPDADWNWWLSQVAAAKAFTWPVQAAPSDASNPALKPATPKVTVSPRLRDAKTIADLATPDSRFFLKSEWGTVSAGWPAFSFSKRSVGDYLNANFNPARDLIFYAGTSDPSRTETPEHRQALISVIIAEPGEPIPTEQLVPWDNWKEAIEKHNKNWPFSFGIRAGWNLTQLPAARQLTPLAYRELGVRKNWGGVAEILGDEKAALFSQPIEWVDLPNRGVVNAASNKRDKIRDIRENPSLNAAISRMEALIRGRLGPSKTVWSTKPGREIPPQTDLIILLYDKLEQQKNLCALCGRILRLDTTKKLLQVSPDRKDSSNPSYGADNLQITHLACNLAKNDRTTEDFEEWLQFISGE